MRGDIKEIYDDIESIYGIDNELKSYLYDYESFEIKLNEIKYELQ